MNNVELYVCDVVRDFAGEIVIVCVPNNGLTLEVGDVMTVKYNVSRDDIMKGVLNPPRLDVRAIELVVEKIDVMRKSVDRLPHGVTGGIYFSGVGVDVVERGCFLGADEMAVVRH